jgi:hypothetical protein
VGNKKIKSEDHVKNLQTRKRIWVAAAAILLGAVAFFLLMPKSAGNSFLILDGRSWSGGTLRPGKTDGLQVYITVDGEDKAILPFDEEHTLKVNFPDGGSNTVRLTGSSVFIAEADCPNQDCVGMGEVTKDNLETRVLGGFIVCLPHRLSVEVRETGNGGAQP